MNLALVVADLQILPSSFPLSGSLKKTIVPGHVVARSVERDGAHGRFPLAAKLRRLVCPAGHHGADISITKAVIN